LGELEGRVNDERGLKLAQHSRGKQRARDGNNGWPVGSGGQAKSGTTSGPRWGEKRRSEGLQKNRAGHSITEGKGGKGAMAPRLLKLCPVKSGREVGEKVKKETAKSKGEAR